MANLGQGVMSTLPCPQLVFTSQPSIARPAPTLVEGLRGSGVITCTVPPDHRHMSAKNRPSASKLTWKQPNIMQSREASELRTTLKDKAANQHVVHPGPFPLPRA